MKLAKDIARCDGLLPKHTQLNGRPITLLSIDCPRRDSCARFCQNERDDPEGRYSYIGHNHGPADVCPNFIAEQEPQEAAK